MTEKYSMGVRVKLRAGQPEDFDVFQPAPVDFWPETIQSNVEVEGLVEIQDVQVENVSVLMSADGMFDFCTADASEFFKPRAIRSPECRHGVRVRGKYLGGITRGAKAEQLWTFFLTFKGPTKMLEMRGLPFTAEEKATRETTRQKGSSR